MVRIFPNHVLIHFIIVVGYLVGATEIFSVREGKVLLGHPKEGLYNSAGQKNSDV